MATGASGAGEIGHADLREEIGFFYENLPIWLEQRHDGFFVLIKGRELLGFFKSADEAYETGIKRLGNVPMLIKQVQKDEPVVSAPALLLGLVGARL